MKTEKTGIPIVLIHRGNSWYLPYTIYQLRKTNPDSTIYLVGDRHTRHFQIWTQPVNINRFFKQAEKFAGIYRHFSTIGHSFELFCIQRWFILLEFMQSQKLAACVYLDSDILVYSDLTKCANAFQEWGMTMPLSSAHTNFIHSRESLEKLCQTIIDHYSSLQGVINLEKRFKQYLEVSPGGGISDMTFFRDFIQEHPE